MLKLDIKALVVDDNRTTLELSAATIQQIFLNVHKADSGKKAIAMCKSKAYDIIFMDLQMPDLDGYETVNVIKKLRASHSSSVRFVALTSTIYDKEQVKKCIEAGMIDCMVKPVTVRDIRSRMKNWRIG